MSSRSMTIRHNGKTFEGEIWHIDQTRLGTEEHGIFTAQLSGDV